MTQRASFGNDDQLLLDSMADEDAYYQGMRRRGSFIGAGTDLFGKAMDYQARISGANLLANLAKKRERRAQDLIDTATHSVIKRVNEDGKKRNKLISFFSTIGDSYFKKYSKVLMFFY